VFELEQTSSTLDNKDHMVSINWQRTVFVVSALAFLLGSFFIPRFDSNTEVIVTGALILFLGVPHGALDLLYLRKVIGVRSPLGIGLSLLTYIATSSLVVILWLTSPLLFLVAFLIISGFHFSGDPVGKVSPLTRFAIGSGVIVFPSIVHTRETEHLYALLTSQAIAETVVKIQYPLAFATMLIGIMALAIEIRKRDYKAVAELVTVGMLATIAPPLLAFTIYFCLMHSARHIVRTSELILLPKRAFFLECLLPMLGVFVSGTVAWQFRSGLTIDAKIIQILFVMLGALTVPHMIIVEPIRIKGWSTTLAPANEK